MDAKSIWPGTDYAWTPHPSKNVEYYENARRIKVIATVDRIESGNTKNTTFVKVFRLTDDGEIRMKREWDSILGEYEEIEYQDEVRAREIFMRWDEYEDETEVRKIKRQEREEELERQRIQRELERQERERQDNLRRENERRAREQRRADINEGLANIGLTGELNEYGQKITISFDDFMKWLHSLEKVECGQCSRNFIVIPRL